ncbi:methyltransferase LaeA-like, putative [Talaromyces stipitatus ATCC 10500]|uniref:Methyltransferase LaeA-like, putative n=1 Tax=Talaromyces stipitatus (strain ATCC 10500 / CBS 375.48 / QM 6759 / NRRL 1006) TaxID=441959 RepID=B8LTU6_TALSN|nr:methyltransferase LaeA-like, putative [Talaromyces stipitatus ATCC 10500]EED23776.1 methyltransferase LaeA-like, putative [Talaromyces stipitatus ATCC 10500]
MEASPLPTVLVPENPQPSNLQGNIEADDRNSSDSDSAFHGSIGDESYTSSISTSVRNYKYENGRRYHAFREGQHVLPNDENEQARMDLAHHIYLMLTGGKLYLSPIHDPQRVLDLGTGTGIWAIDFADEHPNASVLGNDLSPIQPSWVPPNLCFEVDDYESEWAYSTKFDFIHGREMEGMVQDFDRLFTQCYKNLKPGGWAEFQTIELNCFCDDDSRQKAAAWVRWSENLHRAARTFGKNMRTVRTWSDKMRNAGFQNVQGVVFPLPFNTWPKDPKLKELGRYQQLHMFEGVTSYSLRLYTNVLKWPKEEVEALLGEVRKILKDRSCHIYTLVHFVYGQKPSEQED